MQDLAHTLRTRLADHGRFVAPKRPQHAFAVEHYAGRVTYSSELLLDKNKVPYFEIFKCFTVSKAYSQLYFW